MPPSRRPRLGYPRAARAAARLAGVAALTVAATACGLGGDDEPSPTRVPAPISTPAAAGSPAAPAATPPVTTGTPAADGYTATQVLPKVSFGQMTGLFPIPGDDGFALLLTKDGVVRRVSMRDDGPDPATFLDLRDRIIDGPGQEEGLLGLAFAPDYATGRRLFVYYTAGGPRRSVISRFTTSGDAADPASERVILEVPQPFRNHNGGGMEFGPDGYMYIGLGDGGSGGDPMGHGQDTSTLLGSILRIDVSGDAYTVPADNPFAGGGGAPEIWAYGLRNPWRLAFDAATGELWAADVGQDALEEVDRIERGGNYGWNIMEGDRCFRGDDCSTAGLILPRAVYDRDDGCSVTGGYVYRGRALPELTGHYVYGDYCTGIVWAVNTSDASAPVRLMESGRSITSFAQDAAGELYLVTFDEAIFRIDRR